MLSKAHELLGPFDSFPQEEQVDGVVISADCIGRKPSPQSEQVEVWGPQKLKEPTGPAEPIY